MDEYNKTLVLKAELAKKHDMIEKAVTMNFQNDLKAKNVSIEKLKEHITNIKGKNVVESVQNVHNSNVVTSKVYKLDLQPLSPLVKHNRDAHELLVYVNATCLSLKPVSNKLVVVTPINMDRKVSDYLNDVHARVNSKSVKSKSAKSIKKKMWKPTGNVTISRVYYVEGLGHNLFSVGQFCDSDLEVAFRKHTCYVQNLYGADLLSGSRDINLHTISLDDMLKSSLIFLLSKAYKTKAGYGTNGCLI
ncbi:hypothetical protein Tco_0977340 [Tanacetum coccineum]|uniref:Integrase, catalytic region, zinc finger, CCHC-type, peptidase aspartic, catalytic n=1 Tax=Tanacetum coccineum TaxID=301880 RepID=A0ABQ5EJU2_9ASTR